LNTKPLGVLGIPLPEGRQKSVRLSFFLLGGDAGTYGFNVAQKPMLARDLFTEARICFIFCCRGTCFFSFFFFAPAQSVLSISRVRRIFAFEGISQSFLFFFFCLSAQEKD